MRQARGLYLALCSLNLIGLYTVSGIVMTVSPSTVVLGSTAPPKTSFECGGISVSNIKDSVQMTMQKLDGFGNTQVFATADGDGTRFDTGPSILPQKPVRSGGIDANIPSNSFFRLEFETAEMRCGDAGTYECSYSYIADDLISFYTLTDASNLTVSANPSDMKLTALTPDPISAASLVGTTNSPFKMAVRENISFSCHGKIGSNRDTLIRWLMSSLRGVNSSEFMQYAPVIEDHGLATTTPIECSYSRTATMTYTTTAADAERKNYLAFKCYAGPGQRQAESSVFYIQVGPASNSSAPISGRKEEIILAILFLYLSVKLQTINFIIN